MAIALHGTWVNAVRVLQQLGIYVRCREYRSVHIHTGHCLSDVLHLSGITCLGSMLGRHLVAGNNTIFGVA